MMEPTIAERGGENADGKKAIARTAADGADGLSVLIDCGTTTAALTYELVGRPTDRRHQFAQPRDRAHARAGKPHRHAGGEVDTNDEAPSASGRPPGSIRSGGHCFHRHRRFAEDAASPTFGVAAETRGA